jgi:uncharacterized protein YdiU (UPF0061 family)
MNIKFNIQNTFNNELTADTVMDNHVRQVHNACFSYVHPTPCAASKLLHYSPEMLDAIGLNTLDAQDDDFLQLFSGNKIYPDTQPYAMCYGGHQFGHWAGQLGDGRAINLFEVENMGKRWALQLKGAGLTPYSRNADGLAVLRSSIREYLCSEAMYHLGVPTTRALSLVTTGEDVLRDVMYNGNAAYEKGAIVCRVSPSFIRFGNFQILAVRKEFDLLAQLTDYTIRHFYPHLGSPSKETYIAFVQEVANLTIDMVVEWERVGFVHGVMNTDNMSILGLTIDYGPYGWLEDYNPNWTPNTTDARDARYRFGNQGNIAIWNVYQLANALYPLIDSAEPLEAIINGMKENYKGKHDKMMLQKLGLIDDGSFDGNNILDFEHLLQKSEMDMTLLFRHLSNFDGKNIDAFMTLLPTFSYSVDFSLFQNEWVDWLQNYGSILLQQKNVNRKNQMDAVNPKYVLRNYMAQMAIDAAEKEDYTIIDELYHLLLSPYEEQTEKEKWFAKRPEWANHKIGCSMLSCSS